MTVPDFTIPSAGSAERRPSGSVVFSEGVSQHYHLLRFEVPELSFRRIRILVRFRFLGGGNSAFYVNHWGGLDILSVERDGQIKNKAAEAARIEREANDVFVLDATYFIRHPAVLIGGYGGAGFYKGSGQPIFELLSVQISHADSVPMSRAALTVVDVGGRGGLSGDWDLQAPGAAGYLFEPDPEEAERLRKFPVDNVKVIEAALFNEDGPQRLRITRLAGCSSLLVPRSDFLSKFSTGPIFDVVKEVDVECRRYDSLFGEGLVSQPDFIKIDVQGVELQVLQGFGDLLHNVVGVELEAHFYEIYEGQTLLGGIVSFMEEYGLMLRELRPQHSFDDVFLEVNAFFTRRHRDVRDDLEAEKLSEIERVCKIKNRTGEANFLLAQAR